MQFSNVVLAAFVSLAAAVPAEQVSQDVQVTQQIKAVQDIMSILDKPNLYLDPPGKGGSKGDKKPKIDTSDSDCVSCAKYCSDPSNGSGIGAACYIVKCGIKVRILVSINFARVLTNFTSASSVKREGGNRGWSLHQALTGC